MIIDVDDPSTWPPDVLAFVSDAAERLRGSTEYTSDLDFDFNGEDDFRRLLNGHRLIAYHCTRLLDHEVEAIRQEGLRPLTRELIADRVAAAHDHAVIPTELRDELVDAHVFADRDRGHGRADQVCLIVSRRVFDRDVHAVRPLLRTWGGEGIYMSGRGYRLRPMLEALGQPAIVVALVELSASHKQHLCFPDLRKVFTGSVLGLDDVLGDVFYKGQVGPEHVLDIWQPGHPQYDQHPRLPTT